MVGMKDFSHLSVEDYVRMFWRRKWYALIAATLVTGAVFLYALHLPHLYRSQTTILVQAQGISEGYVKPLEYGRVEDRLSVVVQELLSRSLLERVVRGLNLFGYREGGPISMDDAVASLRDALDVKTGTASTISVGFTSTKPALARDVPQRMAEEEIRSRTSSREEQATVTDQFLDQQLQQAEKDLAVQEEGLKAFKMQHLGALPEQSGSNLAALSTLHNQLINNESALQHAQDQQLILEQRLHDLNRLHTLAREVATNSAGKDASGKTVIVNSRASLTSQLEAKRRQLAELELKYTAKFPDVARLKKEVQDLEDQLSRIPTQDNSQAAASDATPNTASPATVEDADTSEIRTQLTILKREVASRQKQNQDLQGQIQVYQGRLNLSPRVEQQLLSITRDYQSVKDHYQSLQEKKFNARVASNLEKSTYNEVLRIIDPAYLPETPVGPNRRRIAMMGLFAGIVLGLGLVVGLEYLDPTLGDEAAASAELNLPVLVSFPEMKPDGKLRGRGSDPAVRRARRA